MPGSVIIRSLNDDDDLVAITFLIRRAYALLSDMGLKFWATYQTVDDTRQRFTDGHGLVAVADGRIVGTITIYPPKPDSEVETYRHRSTYCIGQFAVDPSCQGAGIGTLLHNAALEHIIASGGERVALDTAEQAHHLIAMYERWGYRIVEHADWRPITNYLSVVMLKDHLPGK